MLCELTAAARVQDNVLLGVTMPWATTCKGWGPQGASPRCLPGAASGGWPGPPAAAFRSTAATLGLSCHKQPAFRGGAACGRPTACLYQHGWTLKAATKCCSREGCIAHLRTSTFRGLQAAPMRSGSGQASIMVSMARVSGEVSHRAPTGILRIFCRRAAACRAQRTRGLREACGRPGRGTSAGAVDAAAGCLSSICCGAAACRAQTMQISEGHSQSGSRSKCIPRGI